MYAIITYAITHLSLFQHLINRTRAQTHSLHMMQKKEHLI